MSNSIVNALASAAAGWVFANWTGDATGSSNPVAITMNGNKAVTANFAQPAAIDVGPKDVQVDVGATATFSLHAVGTPVLSYQWWFDGARLDGATGPTLTLANVQPVQEGTYFITVRNPYGMSSRSAVLSLINACTGTNVVPVASEAALRSAITKGGVVSFCFNGTITLAATIDITNDIVLDAHDRAVVIDGNNAVRLLTVSPGVRFSATNLVFRHGLNVGANGTVSPSQPGLPGEGAAILNNGGIVQLSGCTLENNSVTGGMGTENTIAGEGRGGAILVRGGSLLLESAVLSANSAVGGSAFLNQFQPQGIAADALGGAIYITNGTAQLLDCNLISNTCAAQPGGTSAAARGGAAFLASGTVTFSNSFLSANLALGRNAPVGTSYPLPSSAYGGAIATSSGTVTIDHCQIGSNMAQGGNSYRFSGTGEAQGGGLFSSANIVIADTTFSGNQALSGDGTTTGTDGRGGAIYNLGSAALNRSSVISNLAKGGFANGYTQNSPAGDGLGGGIYNGAQLTITNCTIALNSAIGGSDSSFIGTSGSGLGGGVFNTNGTTVAVNITVATNSVAAGQSAGGLHNGVAGGGDVANNNGTVLLVNSIIAYSVGSSNAWGTISDAGFNMSSDGSANFSSGSSFNFTDPLLRALGDYGGPTPTMALQTNSPAVDFGTSTGAPLTDQRGLPRPAGNGVDIGAYELQPGTSQVPILSLSSGQGALQLSFQAQANVTYSFERSTNLANWTEVEFVGPFPASTNIHRLLPMDSQTPLFFRLFVP